MKNQSKKRFLQSHIKKYKPGYIIADRAYDTELIRKCINEEIQTFDQILLKKEPKKANTG